jgi:glutamate-1-semialdehyde 2,1-aminomutase
MTRTTENNRAFFKRAYEVMPLGVSSNFRTWGEGRDLPVLRAEGAYFWDFDENRYIDYQNGFGPVILGHGHPAICDRVAEAIRHGNVFALTHQYEVRTAERIINMCPGVEMVRFANSGTEATMHAVRLARSHTSREKIIKFEGQYHGMHDYVLWSTASCPVSAMGYYRDPIPVASSSGIPKAIRDLIICLPFNDPETLERTIKAKWGDIAGIIVEPMLGNLGGTMPEPGWLETLRSLCDEYGIVLIMDEVKTGFRIARGGAQEYFGVTADLVTYAKAMGNGFPIAALGGRREIMMGIGLGKSAQGGTYCGNVCGTAAADATLEILATGEPYKILEARGKALVDGITSILNAAGVPHHITGIPLMFGIAFSEEKPIDARGWTQADGDLYEAISLGLIERGALPCPDDGEPWFLSAALSEQDVADTLTWFEEALKDALAG